MLGLGNSLVTSGVVEGFLPTQVSGLQLWLANGEGQLGDPVSKWGDASGNLNHAQQTSSGNRGAKEAGGIQFDSSASTHYDLPTAITIASEHEVHVFAVYKLEDATQNTILGRTGLTEDFLEIQSHKQLRFTFDDNTAEKIIYANNSLANATTPFTALFQFVRRAGADSGSGTTAKIEVYKNGTELSVVSYPSGSDGYDDGAITFDTIGARNNDRFMEGPLLELLIYNTGTGNMSQNDSESINNYLLNKFSL